MARDNFSPYLIYYFLIFYMKRILEWTLIYSISFYTDFVVEMLLLFFSRITSTAFKTRAYLRLHFFDYVSYFSLHVYELHSDEASNLFLKYNVSASIFCLNVLFIRCNIVHRPVLSNK